MVDLSLLYEDSILSPVQKQILSLLKENGAMTRQQLVKKSKRARTTLYDNLTRLDVDYQIVKKFPRPTNSRGRPTIFFKIRNGIDRNLIKEYEEPKSITRW